MLKIIYLLLPLIFLPTLGWFLKRFRFFSDSTLFEVKKFLYWVSLPALLINRISSGSSPGKAFPVSLALIIAMASAIIVALIFSLFFHLSSAQRASLIQGAYRGNLAYVGIPLVAYAMKSYFPQSDLTHNFTPELVLAPVVPLYNIVAVFLFSFNSFRRDGGIGSEFLRFGQNIITNPLILGSSAGLILVYTGIPKWGSSILELLGEPALPLALIAVGASINFSKVKVNRLSLFIVVIIKGMISPLVAWGVGQWLGFDSYQMLAVVLFGACPTAISSYILAEKMGGEGEYASSIVMLSTLSSLVIFPIILILYSFQS